MKYYIIYQLVMQLWAWAFLIFIFIKFAPKEKGFWSGGKKYIGIGALLAIVYFLIDTIWGIYLLFTT